MSVPKFVISHIRNEEYMLPWWIDHHKNKFDTGVIIDYGSTDASLDIIREKVPHWTIVRSRNPDFAALPADVEVADIERQLHAQYPRCWSVALNVTEFLIGDTSKLKHLDFRFNCLIEGHLMVDSPETKMLYPNQKVSLIKQRHFGVQGDYNDCRWEPEKAKINQAFQAKRASDPVFAEHGGPWATNRISRSMHNYNLIYQNQAAWPAGRHFWGEPTPDFQILWYGYSPYNKNLIDRRLAVPDQIPTHERNPHMLDANKLEVRFNFYQENAKDLKNFISKYEPNIWSD